MALNGQCIWDLQLPTSDTADRDAVRLGSGSVSTGFPPLRQPSPDTADRGAVRLGSGSVSTGFPRFC
jgi:hypothetical protein